MSALRADGLIGPGTLTGRVSRRADKALVGLTAFGLAVPAMLTPLVGASLTGGLSTGDIIWLAVVAALAAVLLAGILLRDRRPVLATVLG